MFKRVVCFKMCRPDERIVLKLAVYRRKIYQMHSHIPLLFLVQMRSISGRDPFASSRLQILNWG